MQLKDFQLATVDKLEERLLKEGAARMLVADEVGLGKTIVAKGFIERMIVRRPNLRVIYVCNNQQIAAQNLRKLNVTDERDVFENYDRLSLIFSHKKRQPRGLRLLGLSPNTSLRKRSRGGKAEERLFLLYLLRHIDSLRKRRGVLHRFLRLDVKKASWKSQFKQMEFDPPSLLLRNFLAEVKDRGILERLHLHFDQSLHLDKANNRDLISELRSILIEMSIGMMEADLIILDEFQRFQEILTGKEEDDEATELAQQLFRLPNVKLLLLSATPYRMLVQRGEAAPNADHYHEFHDLMEFLIGEDKALVEQYRNAWATYQQKMDALNPYLPDDQLPPRDAVQEILRSVMCRTERAGLSPGGDQAIVTAKETTLFPSVEDLRHYCSGERLVEGYRRAGEQVNSPISYYKSAPYPFSFMDNYKMSNLWRNDTSESNLGPSALNADCWLPLNKVELYEEIEFPNAAFRYLKDRALDPKGYRLLWIPPAKPDYPLRGAFNGTNGYSKTLLFSRWRMVPRALSVLLSYESERLTIGQLKQVSDAYQLATYFTEAEATTKRTGNRLKKTGGGAADTAFNLTYPCLTLACLRLPLTGTPKSQLRQLGNDITELIRKYHLYDDGAGKEDVNWYWQLPVLLDQAKFGGEKLAALYEDALTQPGMEELEAQFKPIIDLLRTPRKEIIESLQRPPHDLELVVAGHVVGSPGVCALRSLGLGRGSDIIQGKSLAACLKIADGFRRFFNRPEATAIVDQNTRDLTYWQQVQQYCGDGNLEAVLKEYFHVVQEALALALLPIEDQHLNFAEELVGAATLQSSSLEVYHPEGSKAMRTHFAVAFTNDKTEDSQQKRDASLRQSFNSPFRPFVLCSTSVGQEGLDFHYYARHVMHWNLPYNPVDLEQREGRINRYKNHAIRLNLSDMLGFKIDNSASFWTNLFAYASNIKDKSLSDLVPYWHLGHWSEELKYPIVRHVPHIGYSKDERLLRDLLHTLPLYRLALGMPDQEGLITALKSKLEDVDGSDLRRFMNQYGLNFSPITYRGNIATKG